MNRKTLSHRLPALLTALLAALLLADLAPAQGRRGPSLRPGVWVDANGDRLELSASRGTVRVKVLSPRLRRFWTEASGPLRGSSVHLEHRLQGQLADVSKGQLSRSGDSIRFTNGTTWRRVATPKLVPGAWKDGNGDRFELRVSGSRLVVTVRSARLQRFWQRAEGEIVGNEVKNLRHLNRGKVVDTTNGAIARDGKSIRFTNGTTWRREVAPKLVPGAWKDGNGDLLELRITGNRLVVIANSARLQRFWQRAEGEIDGNRVKNLRHLNRGRPVDTTAGTIAPDGKSITFTNGTRWNSVPVVVIKPVLSPRPGLWRDGNGDQLRLTLNGTSVHVTAVSPRLRQQWQTATGTLNMETGRIDLRHLNGGRLVKTTRGSVTMTEDIQIRFGPGGNWTFVR